MEVSLTAVQEREFIFHLRCNIKRKPTPLTLNVKAVGHSINIGLSTTDSNGVETMLPLDKGPKRIIDFGKVSDGMGLWNICDSQIGKYNHCIIMISLILCLSVSLSLSISFCLCLSLSLSLSVSVCLSLSISFCLCLSLSLSISFCLSLQVPVNERALWQLSIHNYNQFDLHYEVETSEGCNKKGGAENTLVSIRPMEGIVEAHDKSNNELVFSPITRGTLKNCDLLLKVYACHLSIYLYISLSIYLSIYLSNYLSIYLPIDLFIYMYISIYLPLYRSSMVHQFRFH